MFDALSDAQIFCRIAPLPQDISSKTAKKIVGFLYKKTSDGEHIATPLEPLRNSEFTQRVTR
jgi:hypothetical protein